MSVNETISKNMAKIKKLKLEMAETKNKINDLREELSLTFNLVNGDRFIHRDKEYCFSHCEFIYGQYYVYARKIKKNGARI